MSGKAPALSAANSGSSFQAIYIGATQKVTVGSGSTQSAALAVSTTIVELYADTDCFIAVGPSPTATTSTKFIPASTVLYYSVQPGSKIAVIQSSAGGNLYITEGANS